MAEREIIEELAARTGLLEPRADKREQKERVATFTRMAAWLVRSSGWGNVKKGGENSVQGRSVDKLIHSVTGVVVDVVSKSDGPTTDDPKPPAVQWLAVDTLDPKEFFVAPVNEAHEPPKKDEPKAPTPDDDDLEILLAAYARVIDGLDKMSNGIHALLERIDKLQEQGVKVHF